MVITRMRRYNFQTVLNRHLFLGVGCQCFVCYGVGTDKYSMGLITRTKNIQRRPASRSVESMEFHTDTCYNQGYTDTSFKREISTISISSNDGSIGRQVYIRGERHNYNVPTSAQLIALRLTARPMPKVRSMHISKRILVDTESPPMI